MFSNDAAHNIARFMINEQFPSSEHGKAIMTLGHVFRRDNLVLPTTSYSLNRFLIDFLKRRNLFAGKMISITRLQ